MKIDSEKVAGDFLEIASEQRLNILLKLYEKKYTISSMAKELGATVPEVHRNFTRLSKAGLIQKGPDGYELTIYGKMIHMLLPAFVFVGNNRKFFESHNFGNLPYKFIQRIGGLQNSTHVKGFVKVIEQWKNIHANSEKYIHNILYEVPYSLDIIQVIDNKLKDGIHIRSVFSEDAVIPEERKKILEKYNFKKYIENGLLERKMMKNVQVVAVINEKEAGVLFPTKEGEADMSEMFYSQDPVFHEWCLDYFEHCWNSSGAFREDKIN